MIYACWAGAAKGAHPDFVIVARIQERNGSALIEPLLERARRQFSRRALYWVDAGNSKGDNFFLNFNQHPVVWLLKAFAFFGRQILQSWHEAQGLQKFSHRGAGAGDEEINAFGGK